MKFSNLTLNYIELTINITFFPGGDNTNKLKEVQGQFSLQGQFPDSIGCHRKPFN